MLLDIGAAPGAMIVPGRGAMRPSWTSIKQGAVFLWRRASYATLLTRAARLTAVELGLASEVEEVVKLAKKAKKSVAGGRVHQAADWVAADGAYYSRFLAWVRPIADELGERLVASGRLDPEAGITAADVADRLVKDAKHVVLEDAKEGGTIAKAIVGATGEDPKVLKGDWRLRTVVLASTAVGAGLAHAIADAASAADGVDTVASALGGAVGAALGGLTSQSARQSYLVAIYQLVRDLAEALLVTVPGHRPGRSDPFARDVEPVTRVIDEAVASADQQFDRQWELHLRYSAADLRRITSCLVALARELERWRVDPDRWPALRRLRAALRPLTEATEQFATDELTSEELRGILVGGLGATRAMAQQIEGDLPATQLPDAA
jgi:hypothetical protein